METQLLYYWPRCLEIKAFNNYFWETCKELEFKNGSGPAQEGLLQVEKNELVLASVSLRIPLLMSDLVYVPRRHVHFVASCQTWKSRHVHFVASCQTWKSTQVTWEKLKPWIDLSFHDVTPVISKYFCGVWKHPEYCGKRKRWMNPGIWKNPLPPMIVFFHFLQDIEDWLLSPFHPFTVSPFFVLFDSTGIDWPKLHRWSKEVVPTRLRHLGNYIMAIAPRGPKLSSGRRKEVK